MTKRYAVVAAWSFSVATVQVFACSCAPEAFAPACQKISSTHVVFLGVVTHIEPDPGVPASTIARVYRFQVERVYQGLPAPTREIVVHPTISCTAHYRRGTRYLIFASKLPKTDSVVLSSGCHGSRPAEHAREDVLFLEAYHRNESSTAVFGRVLQQATELVRPRPGGGAPVPNAVVTLDDGSQTLTQVTGQDGEFRFERVPAGSYVLSAQREPYIPNPPSTAVEVSPGGCVEVFPQLEARAGIAGMVTTDGGGPAKKVTVKLLRRNNAGEWRGGYNFSRQTDFSGRFQFENLPSGDYLLGHEIWGDRPSNHAAHPTRYYPGVEERERATVIHLEPLQTVENLNFSLSKPHTPRKIRVTVSWPDGTSPTKHLLQLSDGYQLLKNVGGSIAGKPGAIHNGVIEFSGFAERTYELHVRYWIDDLGGPVPHDLRRIAKSDVVKLPPGVGPANVRLVLTTQMLADDDR